MDITIGQVITVLAVIAGAIGSVSAIVSAVNKNLKKYLTTVIKTELEPIKQKLDEVTADLDKVDLNSCKNYLVRFLSDIEQGNPVDEIEKERFYEQFEHYERVGGNSYIHSKVDKLRQKGLL